MKTESQHFDTLFCIPYTLERAPWALFSFLLAGVGGLPRVGALSNVQNNVKIWALFLSESSGVGALSRLGALSSVGLYGMMWTTNTDYYYYYHTLHFYATTTLATTKDLRRNVLRTLSTSITTVWCDPYS